MPSVNLSPETYAALKQIAAERGCPPDEVVKQAVAQSAAEWAERLQELEQRPTETWSEEETSLYVDYAIAEVRAEARARGLSDAERLAHFDQALSAVRAGIPPDVSEDELTQEIDAALAEVRAERRARSR